MTDIKLKIKLSAYTKGILPDTSDFVIDTPQDNKVYGRKNRQWVDLTHELDKTRLMTDENSGIKLEQPEIDTYKISLKQWTGKIEDLPETLENDTTYYTITARDPDIFVIGGTAFSDENEEYGEVFIGGTANTSKFDCNMLSLNCKGEYDDRN